MKKTTRSLLGCLAIPAALATLTLSLSLGQPGAAASSDAAPTAVDVPVSIGLVATASAAPVEPAPQAPVEVQAPSAPPAPVVLTDAERKAEAKRKAEEKAEARRLAAEERKAKEKERIAKMEAKAEEDFARCKTPLETVMYTSGRIPQGEYRKATATNPFCNLARVAPVEKVDDAALVAAEREWLDSWRTDRKAKRGQEPVARFVKDDLPGAMRRAVLRYQAMDERPAGWDDALARSKEAWDRGEREEALRSGSAFLNSAGRYCIHPETADRRCDRRLTKVPAEWMGEYSVGALGLFERGGGDCRDYSIARWLFWKEVGVPDEDNAIMEGGHGNGAYDGIVHVWNVVRLGDQVFVADYPTPALDRSLVPMRKASWLSGVGAWDVATDGRYSGFGLIRGVRVEQVADRPAREENAGG